MGRGVTLWLCRPSIRTRWWAGHHGNCLRNSVLTSQTGVSHHSSSTVMRCHLERAVESPHVYMQPGDPVLPCIRAPLHSSHWFHFSRSHFTDYVNHFELVVTAIKASRLRGFSLSVLMLLKIVQHLFIYVLMLDFSYLLTERF